MCCCAIKTENRRNRGNPLVSAVFIKPLYVTCWKPDPDPLSHSFYRYGCMFPNWTWGLPVWNTNDHTLDDSTVTRTYTSSSCPVSTLSDEQLDHFVADILEIFPSFDQQMLSGRLKASGHYVPRDKIAASYLHVHGSFGIFGTWTIHWKVYKVAGANSLAHHGQHGVHLLSNLCLSLTSHFYRTYMFQNCHTLLYWQQVLCCHWHECQWQQLCTDGIQLIYGRDFYTWGPKSHPRWSWHWKCPGCTVDEREQECGLWVLHLGQVGTFMPSHSPALAEPQVTLGVSTTLTLSMSGMMSHMVLGRNVKTSSLSLKLTMA